MTATQHRPSRWAALRDEMRARRRARENRRALEAELAAFSSPADQLELDAILERHSDAEAIEVRRIVDRFRAA
jgi:hypothetical protein